jgi:hypothetical protein
MLGVASIIATPTLSQVVALVKVDVYLHDCAAARRPI